VTLRGDEQSQRWNSRMRDELKIIHLEEDISQQPGISQVQILTYDRAQTSCRIAFERSKVEVCRTRNIDQLRVELRNIVRRTSRIDIPFPRDESVEGECDFWGRSTKLFGQNLESAFVSSSLSRRNLRMNSNRYLLCETGR